MKQRNTQILRTAVLEAAAQLCDVIQWADNECEENRTDLDTEMKRQTHWKTSVVMDT